MKRVFITGVSGLLGTHLVHEFLDHDYEVSGLLRNKSSYRGRKHPRLRLVEGDLFTDLGNELTGTGVVIHAAAETRQNLLHYNDYRKINCNATILLYLSAVQCGVGRFVYISTANTMGHGTATHPGDESLAPREPFTSSLYARSKAEAEESLLERNGKTGVTILNPSFMLGAYGKATGSARIVQMAMNKKLLFIPPGGKNFVDVRDVARAARLAAEQGKNGERYLAAGENLSYACFFERLNRISGQHTRLVILPPGLLLAAGYAGDLLRKLGIRTGLSSVNMKILCENNFYTAGKSEKALGMHYHNIGNAIRETLNWLGQDHP